MTPKTVRFSGMLTVPIVSKWDYQQLGPKIEKIKMKGEKKKSRQWTYITGEKIAWKQTYVTGCDDPSTQKAKLGRSQVQG